MTFNGGVNIASSFCYIQLTEVIGMHDAKVAVYDSTQGQKDLSGGKCRQRKMAVNDAMLNAKKTLEWL